MCVLYIVVDEQLQQRQKHEGLFQAANTLIKFKEKQVRSKNRCNTPQKKLWSGYSHFQVKETAKRFKKELPSQLWSRSEAYLKL